MAQPDGLRLYISESSESACVAKGIHRSGSRIRPISVGDPLLSGTGESESVSGIVVAVQSPERIDRDNWVYRLQYRPVPGTVHPLDSWVVWRQIESAPKVPAIAVRRQTLPTPAPLPIEDPIAVIEVAQVAANGRKRKKVTGQQDNGALASSPGVTA